jgi:uncharacterized membrane protein (DUF485 family)
MSDPRYERLRASPRFKELCRARGQLAWILSAVMLVLYYGFVLLVAFGQGFLARPLWDGATMTVGLPIGIGVILSAIVLTGIYVWRANTYFDELQRRLLEEVR